MAEHVTGIRRLAHTAFRASGVSVPAAPYCGKVAPLEDGMLQIFDLDRLLPEDAQAILFHQPDAVE
jgi:chemotaxis signal transduction protein